MTRQEFYELIDIEAPEDFQYFENLAAFLECEEELEYEHVAQLVKEIDKNVFCELVCEYFEEISDFVPEDENEVFEILENVKRAFTGMAASCKDETMAAKLADELERFRRWYSADSKVYLTEIGSLDEKETTLRDAIVAARLEKIDGDKYLYDFSECGDYKLDEYIVSFGELCEQNV